MASRTRRASLVDVADAFTAAPGPDAPDRAAGHRGANRRDYEAAFALYDPGVELLVPPGLVAMGLEPRVRGRKARIQFEVRWRTEWGDFQYAPEELSDLGNQVLVVGRMRGSGPSSGAAFDNEWADLFSFSRGRVTREQVSSCRSLSPRSRPPWPTRWLRPPRPGNAGEKLIGGSGYAGSGLLSPLTSLLGATGNLLGFVSSAGGAPVDQGTQNALSYTVKGAVDSGTRVIAQAFCATT